MSQTQGKTSQSKNNSRSSEVTPTKDARDDFARLTSADGPPTMDKQWTRQEEKQLVINLATLHDYVKTECFNLSSSNRHGRFSIYG